MKNRFIFSGGPGTGKTTTLRVLNERGFSTMPDVARAIIQERWANGLPHRPDPLEFAKALVARNTEQYDSAPEDLVLFDYSLVESLLMLREAGEISTAGILEQLLLRPYFGRVVFFPPWKEIYIQDSERDHAFEHCLRVSNDLKRGFAEFGFDLIEMPMTASEQRADLVEAILRSAVIL